MEPRVIPRILIPEFQNLSGIEDLRVAEGDVFEPIRPMPYNLRISLWVQRRDGIVGGAPEEVVLGRNAVIHANCDLIPIGLRSCRIEVVVYVAGNASVGRPRDKEVIELDLRHRINHADRNLVVRERPPGQDGIALETVLT